MAIPIPPLNLNLASSARSGESVVGSFNFSTQKGFTAQQILIAGGILVAGFVALRYLQKVGK